MFAALAQSTPADTSRCIAGTLREGGTCMRSPNSKLRLLSVLLILAAGLLAATPRAIAQHESLLYSFNPGSRDGLYPQANLIFDTSGNLYGTTFGGGTNGCFGSTFDCGTVFELSHAAGGGWSEKVLHNFGKGIDGVNPSAGMIFDSSGNLYGTTYEGGAYYYGTVFELSPTADGGWTERVLHHFNFNGRDGMYPVASLIRDASGNLYGTTFGGGIFNAGTVFELTPAADGSWTPKILHSFGNRGVDGMYPSGSLSVDGSGNLYSTTFEGGIYDWGTVFELSPTAGGAWTEKILHNFNYNDKDGLQPVAGLTFDVHGNLYGTAAGGLSGYGTVFELTPAEGGGWSEKILYNFDPKGNGGFNPGSGVVFDANGNLYGTTISGGLYTYGTVFELSPTEGGGWSEKTLHNFSGTLSGADGRSPEASVTVDATGNVYGTTNQGGAFGGAFGYGTVFEITP
jgi:uncharacterized repeat protein (TIGR03803 family)